MQFITVIALAVYAACTILYWRRIQQNRQSATGVMGLAALVLSGGVAAALHAWLLGQAMLRQSHLDLALGNVVSLVSLMTVIVFLLATLRRDVANLGCSSCPLDSPDCSSAGFSPEAPLIVDDASPLLWWHLGVALLAFGFLCMAAAQAIVLFFQDRYLHGHKTGSLLPALPPIQTMEENLFRLTLIGVILLTANLVIGVFFLHDQIGRKLRSIIIYCCHSLPGWALPPCSPGHRVFGWRGEVAARWTLAAFSFYCSPISAPVS